MARMYPDPIQPEVKSEAEKDLYEAFQQQLDDSYVVIHSANWQYPEGVKRVPRNGEADFIIVHPEKGILVMEVKGGTIRRNAQSGEWTSTTRTGEVHAIKDPFEQAKKSMYTILEDLKKDNRLPDYILIGHVVAFPDCHVGNTIPLGLDMPRKIIIDDTDMQSLAKWVKDVFAYYQGAQTTKVNVLSKDGVEIVRKRIMPDIELRPVMWGDFQREQKEMIRLTKEQCRILEYLNAHQRALICGPAGSGKTLLALEKAVRLTSQGFKVLYTCYNRDLADDIRVHAKNEPPFDIMHFHQLCTRITKMAGQSIKAQNTQKYFDEDLPTALLNALDKIQLRYDAIIVDEGQDFHDAWWLPLQMLLTNPDEGILYIFYDDNQRLYSKDRDWPIKISPVSLTTNCRNTQEIHRALTKFYQGVPITVQGPPGRPVEAIPFESSEQQGEVLGKLLDRLVTEENIPTREITVLSPFTAEHSQVWEHPPAGKIRLTTNWPSEKNRVYFSTIHSFKGLERSVIILIDLEYWSNQREDLVPLLYVGCSRASHQLYVVRPKRLSGDKRELLTF